uniref:Uncharacterized protein n=1 Tax=Candidatus Kentrum sp. LPFa TaxID=2126335 RepID=A0A450VVE5_9GAMM|nr:MAG: hypothetical protein BECKLPF1236A_GA0070988_1002012 [Candidatus Kentron sp. LPFa]
MQFPIDNCHWSANVCAWLKHPGKSILRNRIASHMEETPNDHVEGFITPADEKRARVAIHPTAPNRGCCFIVKG